MSERKHAVLSASSSGKWLVCTPSAQLENKFVDEDSAFAAEGTLAHEVFEQMLNLYLGVPGSAVPEGTTVDMMDHVQCAVDYAVTLIEQARERCTDPVIYVERKLDFSPWVPEGFGTGDLVIITDDLVEIADLKYGKGVGVSPTGNSQMRLYGLGAYNEMNHLYDIRRVRTHVLQPRLDNWGYEEMTVEDLLLWAENVVVPKALIAWEGQGEMVAGDHCHSYFCRARFTCPKRNQAAQELVDTAFAFEPPDMLTDKQMAQVLARADQVIKWLNDVKDWGFKTLESGKSIPGFKLVEGRSNRRYVDQDAVAEALIEKGYDAALIYEHSLLGITAMEKLLGKKAFAEILGTLIEKPAGKPTLVPESDKRPAYDALAYFNDETPQEGL